MKTKTQTKRTILFHPILFGIYPVLALYVFNRNETVLDAMQQALITSLIVTVITIAVFLLIFHSWEKAAAPASFSLLLFYSYGHVYDLAQNLRLFGEVIGRDRVLVPVWVVLFIIGQVLLLRSQKRILNDMFNSISMVLMILLFVQVVIPWIQSGSAGASSANEPVSGSEKSSDAQANRDVYYILVDAYSRQDLLQEELDLDIGGFISELTSLGFYIPQCAQSNYDNTLSSLTTTLNMNYLDALNLEYQGDKATYKPHIDANLVMQRFKEMGYSVATFKSLYRMLDLPGETYYFDYFENASSLNSQASLNFQYLFLKTTFVRPLMEYVERNPETKLPSFLARWIPTGNTFESREYRQYQQNVFAFESLEKLPDLPGKKFVYAHLYSAHQPYVFYSDGGFNPDLKQGPYAYRDQIIYTNARLLEIVKTILAKSDPAPVIVIQGDHSFFEGADRVKILNAYYLPDGGEKSLYSTITPVNTFRIIFNTYFGGQYELLPDVSKYGDENKNLYDVPSTCVE